MDLSSYLLYLHPYPGCDIISAMTSIGTPTLWIGFTLFVFALLALDLGVFHRKAHAISIREAAGWSIFWILLSLGFNLLIYHFFGTAKALEFLTGYLIEKSLSVDNIFVFLVILNYFSVAPAYQHRVLFWGILGALISRFIFIMSGAWLLHTFHWVEYLFGAFLVFTGIRLFRENEVEVHPEKNLALRIFKRFIPTATDYQGPALWIRQGAKWVATPLFLVLIVVEATDIVFAVDSIPAIFGITHDPFIVYTSNIFAILGLRALYFLLAGIMRKFEYLNEGLAGVLVFVGAKMLIADYFPIPIGWSLAVVGGILTVAFAASLIRKR